jgi:hypothetical protein
MILYRGRADKFSETHDEDGLPLPLRITSYYVSSYTKRMPSTCKSSSSWDGTLFQLLNRSRLLLWSKLDILLLKLLLLLASVYLLCTIYNIVPTREAITQKYIQCWKSSSSRMASNLTVHN